jgi:hypothetical protein
MGLFGFWDQIKPDFPDTPKNLFGVSGLFGYWDHSVNGVIFGLAQSDPIY